MPGPSPRHQPPRSYAEQGQWPNARLRPHHGAAVTQEIARRLGEVMVQRKLSANRLAGLSGVNRQTISNVLTGRAWPDLITIANLEKALNTALWPPYETTQINTNHR